MSKNQTAGIISTYTADVSGVCSALYELGGMTVIHDASGCNSTYNTHDEPRWFDTDSMVFISALTETDAVMGCDDKLIGDIVNTASELHPKFIAIAGSPIPMITGTDFKAVARIVESETGIPTEGIPTNGMHSYIAGANAAFSALARRIDGCRLIDGCSENVVPNEAGSVSVNLLGVTPLDFSVNGSDRSMVRLLEDNGINVISSWAMGFTLEDIKKAPRANANIVVSACGMGAAEILRERFGTPYVVGAPIGEKSSAALIGAIKQTALDGICRTPYAEIAQKNSAGAVIIGENVYSQSLAAALRMDAGIEARVICPLERIGTALTDGGAEAVDEDDIIPKLTGAELIIADPLYKPICPTSAAFIPLPHEAFSGRIFRQDIPDLTGSISALKL